MFGRPKAHDPFLQAFQQQAAAASKAAQLLSDLLADISRAEQLAAEIKDVEHEGDRITYEAVKRLRSQWITPFDRADIHELATELDDILDAIDATARRVTLFHVRDVPEHALTAGRTLQASVAGVGEILGLLGDMKNAPRILELCVEVNRLEDEADEVYRCALAELFQEQRDAFFVMKWREIFEWLERACDRCEDVANRLEGIVLEYS